ncbi:hypothetical protein BS47DRAFT_1487962 [Hydnum rufescens UP504]|uniref:Fungal-type protein kinase domain-containing protein n=1 Tax=Hydnum rufescens UP504 TaxID=1448309 RepID=A0A9P6AP53_9AGAM|nr:hypothetical protein BS47DRAFT_1487962 [Hydnum rufescens UP504]
MSGSKVPHSDRDNARAPGGLLPSVDIHPGPLRRHDQSAPPRYSIRISSHSDESSCGVAELRPLIDEDLKYRKEIPLDQFIKHMLGGRIDDRALKQLCDAKATKELLKEFYSQAGPETTRYQPSANLANHFLNSRKASALTFCRNDPRFIQGPVAERKLDVVLVSTKSPQLDHGAELPKGPTVGSYWDDLHWSVKFKVKVTEPEKEAEAVMSASSSLPVPSHGYTGGTADLHIMRSMSNEDSRKWTAGSPPSGQPHATKSHSSADHSEERRQSAFYALEMLSHGRYRSHVINIMIQDTSMRLWFYDRVGIIMSAAFSVTDLALFGRVMFAMSSLPPSG